jgi:hypothetical protein
LNHQPEAQHPKSSAIHKLPADYPIFWGTPDMNGWSALADCDVDDPTATCEPLDCCCAKNVALDPIPAVAIS